MNESREFAAAGSAAGARVDEAAQGQVRQVLQAVVDTGAAQLQLAGGSVEPPGCHPAESPGTNRSLWAQP